MEKTLVLLKPDTIERGLVGEVIQRFERVGLKIIGLKMLLPTQTHAEAHYTEDLAIRRGEAVRKMMIEMLTSGPVIALALEGLDAVEVVRKMIGGTEPKTAAPGTIRGDYSHVSIDYANSKGVGILNLVHASGSPEEAKTELEIWFSSDELVDHNPHYTKHTLI